MRLLNQARESLSQRFAGGEKRNRRRRIFRGNFQLMPFRHGEQAIEELRLHGEKLQFERTKLAGANDAVGVAQDDQAVPGGQLPGFSAMLQPVARALGHARHHPSVIAWNPFGGRRQGQRLQNEVSFNGHKPRY